MGTFGMIFMFLGFLKLCAMVANGSEGLSLTAFDNVCEGVVYGDFVTSLSQALQLCGLDPGSTASENC